MFNIGTYSPQNPLTGATSAPAKSPLSSAVSPSESGFDGASLVRTNGNPLGGVYAQPGRFGNPEASTPPPPNGSTGFGGTGWQPSFRNDVGGYNSSQYADLNTTNTLASQLGGNAVQTPNAGGFSGGPPPQNMISFGGTGVLNAGLLAERYAKYDRATADAMTRAELALMGQNPGTSEGDTQGGSLGFASQFTGLPGGTQAIGQGANLGSSMPATAPVTPAAASVPGTSPLVTGNVTPPTATTAAPTTTTTQTQGTTNNSNQINASLLSLLSMLIGGGANQAYQPYANSNYYPSLPRGFGGNAAMTPSGLQALLRAGSGNVGGAGAVLDTALTPSAIQAALRGGSGNPLLSLLLGF